MPGASLTSSRLLKALAVSAIVFGALAVAGGGCALFGHATDRTTLGHRADYVSRIDFLAGFADVAAGTGLRCARRWGAVLSAVLALVTAAIATARGCHVMVGAYQMCTAGVLTLKSGFWAVVSLVT